MCDPSGFGTARVQIRQRPRLIVLNRASRFQQLAQMSRLAVADMWRGQDQRVHSDVDAAQQRQWVIRK